MGDPRVALLLEHTEQGADREGWLGAPRKALTRVTAAQAL